MKSKLIFACLLLACFARYAAGSDIRTVVIEEAMDEILVIHSFYEAPDHTYKVSNCYKVFFIRNGQIMAVRSFNILPNNYHPISYVPTWGVKDDLFHISFDEDTWVEEGQITVIRSITAKEIVFITTKINPNSEGSWWNQNRNMRDLKQP